MYSKNRKKHNTYIKKVLKKFRITSFQVDINKCEYFVIEIKYLKLIISINEITINFAKIKSIIQ